MTARSPALNAMASDHVAKLASYFISDPSALAAAGDYLTHKVCLPVVPQAQPTLAALAEPAALGDARIRVRLAARSRQQSSTSNTTRSRLKSEHCDANYATFPA